MAMTEQKQGNFVACTDDKPQTGNWFTAIYEDDYDGLLIAMCNQNGRYPHHVTALLNGLDGKRQSMDTITRLEAENRDLRAKLQEWDDAANATDIYEYLAEALARNGTVGPKGIRQMVAYCADLRAKLETVEAETIERAVKRVKADKDIQGLVKARIFTILRNLEPRHD